jgi:TonB-linked SusC/RagA family outer membrane protein
MHFNQSPLTNKTMKYFRHPVGVRNKYWLFKSILIMKLICFFIVIFSFQSVAKVYSQQKVTLNIKSADFTKVITAIQKQTNYHFVFSERKIPASKKITVTAQNEDVTSVLTRLLANSGFTFTQLENNLIVITSKDEVVNNAVIHGKVLDENGLAFPGVSVKIKGTSTGTVTDANGQFSVNTPDNAVLQFSFLGYETQEVAVDGKTDITVKMATSSKSLSEVVVTALGIKKDERKLGYAVTTVGGDVLNKAKESNVALSLEGRVAGVSVSGTNGGPGSTASLLLRGVTSLTAGQPLYVINGVPMDNTQRGASGEWGGADYGDGISNINPDDIESMTVLKGQSASALYGSRAANGVILITTKSGKKNSGFGIEFNSNYQADKVIDTYDFQTEYGQGKLGAKPTNATDALNTTRLGWGAKLDGSSFTQFDGSTQSYSASGKVTDFYRTANNFTNTVSFDGGNETGAFRLSLSDLDAKSVVINSGLDRKTINLNANQNVTKQLNITVVANYIYENSKNRSSLSDGPNNPNNGQFLANNVNQLLLSPGTDAAGNELAWTDDIYATNPYFAANKIINNAGRKRLISALTAKYNINSWIYAQGRLGYDNSNDTRFKVTPTGTLYTGGLQGQLDDQIATSRYELNTDVLIGAKHDIVSNWLNLDFAAGGNIRKNQYEGSRLSGNRFILPGFYSFTNLLNKNNPDVYYEKSQANSAYYTADFAFKNYLTLSTTGRYDVYSTLPQGNQSIFTPSVSASFAFSELTNTPNLDFGKLRVSYAKTSGEPKDVYITSSYYGLNGSINGYTPGSFSLDLPNLFLGPYTLTEFEIGTSLKMFQGRLGIDVAYFNRKTKDEILKGSLDISSGYNTRYISAGSVQNRGVEVELTGSPVRSKDFTWSPSFNFTYVKNNIVHTDNTNTTISLGTYRPLNANTAFVVDMAGPQIMATDYLRNASGQIVFDASGLPLAEAARTPHGSVVPKYYGGFNNDFFFKKFNLSFLVDYKFGNKILSATNYYSITRGLNKSTLPGRDGGVVGEGVTEGGAPNTVNVDAQTYYQALAQRVSAINVLDGSFIKLRQITFGYSFNSEILKGSPFSNINVSLVARNLWTIMKHTDNIDPESAFASVGGGNNVNYLGIEGTSLPAIRSYGVNLNFRLKK